MKKVYQYLLLAGLVVLAAACENEIAIDNGVEGSEQQMITETISANILGETKATVDANAKFAWTVGDNIAVHVSNGKYVFTSGTGGASEAAASASFTVSYPVETSRDFFAIFPSTIVDENAANYGQSEHSLDVTLPASYALDEVSGTATPCPMIATNTPGSGWTFSQLCGLLRLSVNSIPSDATGLIVQFPGKKVNGNFAIASPVTPGTSTIMTDTPASGEDQITVTFSAGITSATINLPLPTGVYEDVFITPVGSATKVAAVRHISAGSYTAQAAHGKKLTTTLVSFSVASNKKAIFSPANLVATIGSTYETTKWFFHANQYDMVHTVSSSAEHGSDSYQSFKAGKDIDLFGFVGAGSSFTENAAWGITGSNNNADYGSGDAPDPLKHDWGKSVIGNYTANFWSTPSITAWEYVFRTRTTAAGTAPEIGSTQDARFCKAMLFNNGAGGVLGVILFPDNYVHPDGVATPAGINDEGGDASSVVNLNNYSKADWEKMEAAGAVFLPSAGYRTSNIISGANSYTDATVSMAVRLRSCTASETSVEQAGRVNVNTANMAFSDNQRQLGMSVRLIREL